MCAACHRQHTCTHHIQQHEKTDQRPPLWGVAALLSDGVRCPKSLLLRNHCMVSNKTGVMSSMRIVTMVKDLHHPKAHPTSCGFKWAPTHPNSTYDGGNHRYYNGAPRAALVSRGGGVCLAIFSILDCRDMHIASCILSYATGACRGLVSKQFAAASRRLGAPSVWTS